MIARFGPAGNSDSFYDEGHKATVEAPLWLHTRGLTAYEYQCGRGVRVSEETARAMGEEAAKYGVALSLHAPYFISLASAEAEKRDNSIRYTLESARAVTAMGGTRIVVHPGGLGGLSRADATVLASETLRRAQQALDDEGLSSVHICPETMGKINQLGDLEEVLTFCRIDERFLPCIDFGHLNCRTLGGVNSKDAFAAILDRLQDVLGTERAARFHSHFSKIEYTAGGEKRHLTFADTQFGPEPAPLMQLIAERGWSPTFISESDGTQAEDAAEMKRLYEEAAR
jgi:deoxyribonuclease-4